MSSYTGKTTHCVNIFKCAKTWQAIAEKKMKIAGNCEPSMKMGEVRMLK